MNSRVELAVAKKCFREILKQLPSEMATYATALIMTQNGSSLSGRATTPRSMVMPALLSINMGEWQNWALTDFGPKLT